MHQFRVLVDPQAIDGVDAHVAVDLGERGRAGLHVRNNVCVPTTGSGATHVVSMSAETWAQLLTGRTTMSDATTRGLVTVDGDKRLVRRIFNAFDVASLHS
ncbi:MAG: alkyl sulfatase C-terminal domain-containing protein [Actinomycetota bacterium]